MSARIAAQPPLGDPLHQFGRRLRRSLFEYFRQGRHMKHFSRMPSARRGGEPGSSRQEGTEDGREHGCGRPPRARRYNLGMAKVVAVIGASKDRRKFGNKALRAFAQQGYEVVAINPAESDIEGCKTYRSVLDVPGRIDIATVYVPPQAGLQVVEELAQRGGVEEIWLNPGADEDTVVARARELGLKTIQACSILAIGESPSRY